MFWPQQMTVDGGAEFSLFLGGGGGGGHSTSGGGGGGFVHTVGQMEQSLHCCGVVVMSYPLPAPVEISSPPSTEKNTMSTVMITRQIWDVDSID